MGGASALKAFNSASNASRSQFLGRPGSSGGLPRSAACSLSPCGPVFPDCLPCPHLLRLPCLAAAPQQPACPSARAPATHGVGDYYIC